MPEASDPVDYGDADTVNRPDGKIAYRFRYKQAPDDSQYLVIENEFKDRGGIPGLLTYTAEAGNRITIEQKLDTAGKGAARLPSPDNKEKAVMSRSVPISWRVDRFEAHERALGEEHKFDTLRDSYPVASLRRLGTANEAVVTLERDPWTGVSERLRIQPGRNVGPATRRKLSKTTQKCLLDNKNVSQLLDDIGPLILPRVPRQVGESWTRTRDKEIRNFGKSVTTYRLTIDRVDENPDGALVAAVSIAGDIQLVADPMPGAADQDNADDSDDSDDDEIDARKAPNRKTGRRVNGAAKQKRHAFKLDGANVSGAYTFDITHGMLLDFWLRRDASLSADMESEQMGKMSLENSEAHMLRVKTMTRPPEKPIVVGGPKPPKDAPEDMIRPPRRTPKRKQDVTTTRPSDPRSRAEDYAERRRKALEQIKKRREAALKRTSPTTQPTTSQPARPITPNVTTQPATGVRPSPTVRPIPRNVTSRPAPIQSKRPTSGPAETGSTINSKAAL